MSTITAPAPPRTDRPGPTLRASARVVVRQHRRALWIAGALALVVAGFSLWAAQATDAFAADPCSGGSTGLGCDARIQFNEFMWLFQTVLVYGGLALIVLPGVVAAFVAGPMIAREFESGTYKVSWTQSVSPTHWLLAKLAVPAVLLLAGVSALSAVFAWARTHSGIDHPPVWFGPVFSTIGTVPVAYALFGLAIGALTGVLVRRTVPAMSVALIATGAVATVLTTQLAALWPRRTALSGSNPVNNAHADAWIVDTGRITADGRRLPMETCWPARSTTEEARCLADHHITGFYADYHPASHFWPLQLVESGILLVLAAAAVAVAFRVLRRRHA
ncbi:ABC transporter permease [Streptomyces sp. NPDC091265]|uniref:ABC transporter permease n=1 Tax=unclassified Streptomyces TaxID=2593676 RepID=UPI00344E1BE5